MKKVTFRVSEMTNYDNFELRDGYFFGEYYQRSFFMPLGFIYLLDRKISPQDPDEV